jgi:cytochrome o ubiquinol oxidase subunit 2
MAGMQTKLHLIANEVGEFRGIAANYNGEGFSDMHFSTLSLSPPDFEQWVAKVRKAPQRLDQASYAALAKPSTRHPVSYYSQVQERMFLDIVDKYEGMNKANRTPRSQAQRDGTGVRTVHQTGLAAEER